MDGRANMYTWRDELDETAIVLAKARPVVEASGSPTHKATFYAQLSNQQAHETRYCIDDETLANARLAVQVAEKGVGEHDLAYCLGTLGEYSLWHGDLDAAQEDLARGFGPFRTYI